MIPRVVLFITILLHKEQSLLVVSFSPSSIDEVRHTVRINSLVMFSSPNILKNMGRDCSILVTISLASRSCWAIFAMICGLRGRGARFGVLFSTS